MKSGKMDTRKSRVPVSNLPAPTPPNRAEVAATQEMNEALDEVSMSPHQHQPTHPPSRTSSTGIEQLPEENTDTTAQPPTYNVDEEAEVATKLFTIITSRLI